MKIIKKGLKILFRVIIGLFVIIGSYLIAERILSRITIAEVQDGQPKQTIIYVLSNGVHTDVVLPVKHACMNWSTLFPYINTTGKDSSFAWVGIGWGDKGFYLNTPEWKDLKASTAFTALFGLGETALHVTYHQTITESSLCRKIALSDIQYQKLVHYVQASLDHDTAGRPIYIQPNAQYGSADAFYEAAGAYSLLHTCNTWTNSGLKSAGLKAAEWTAFDKGILFQYR